MARRLQTVWQREARLSSPGGQRSPSHENRQVHGVLVLQTQSQGRIPDGDDLRGALLGILKLPHPRHLQDWLLARAIGSDKMN